MTHVTVGVGGANLEGTGNVSCLWKGGCPPPAWIAYRAMHHAAVKLRFTATAIEGQVLCGPDTSTPSNLTDMTCTVATVIDTFTVFDQGNASVPGPTVGAFGLERVAPNPTTAGVSVSYSLQGWEPATLEVLDPAGREILRRKLGDPGPGRHLARLGPEAFRSPGVYFVRLRQSGRTAIAKLSVTALGR